MVLKQLWLTVAVVTCKQTVQKEVTLEDYDSGLTKRQIDLIEPRRIFNPLTDAAPEQRLTEASRVRVDKLHEPVGSSYEQWGYSLASVPLLP